MLQQNFNYIQKKGYSLLILKERVHFTLDNTVSANYFGLELKKESVYITKSVDAGN